MTSRNRLTVLSAVIVCILLAVAAYALFGRHRSAPAPAVRSSGGSVCQSRLPGQARDTLTLIAKHGPFPYRNDGIVFENRENRLPRQGTGYYHEYTVVTPGSGDRGTRRIVTGSAGEEYWTGDHYASFQRINASC